MRSLFSTCCVYLHSTSQHRGYRGRGYCCRGGARSRGWVLVRPRTPSCHCNVIPSDVAMSDGGDGRGCVRASSTFLRCSFLKINIIVEVKLQIKEFTGVQCYECVVHWPMGPQLVSRPVWLLVSSWHWTWRATRQIAKQVVKPTGQCNTFFTL